MNLKETVQKLLTTSAICLSVLTVGTAHAASQPSAKDAQGIADKIWSSVLPLSTGPVTGRGDAIRSAMQSQIATSGAAPDVALVALARLEKRLMAAGLLGFEKQCRNSFNPASNAAVDTLFKRQCDTTLALADVTSAVRSVAPTAAAGGQAQSSAAARSRASAANRASGLGAHPNP